MSDDFTSRTAMLLGEDGAIKMKAATVAVIGLGGVGSFAAEALARAGVGRLILVDGDIISNSNRNRQLIALTSTMGRNKAEVMSERARDINPDCRAEAHAAQYRPGESEYLLDGCDYVADCVDMVSAKLALAETCRDKKIPLIAAMGCGNKLDPTRFRTADIYDTAVCPLCRVMRRELKARGIEHLRVVYSDEPPMGQTEKDPVIGKAVPGSVSFVPSVAGLIIAGEIVKAIAQR